jgi:hypothetical protein
MVKHKKITPSICNEFGLIAIIKNRVVLWLGEKKSRILVIFGSITKCTSNTAVEAFEIADLMGARL